MDRRTFLVTAAVLAGDTKLGISSPLRRGRTIALGDDQVQVVLEYGTEGLFETQFLVEKHPLLGLRGSAWTVEIDGAILRPEGIVSLKFTRKRAGSWYVAPHLGAKPNPNWLGT